MSAERQIDEGVRIANFLGDEIVQSAFARLAEKYVEEWKSGQTPDVRDAAWGKSRALDDLKIELQAVVDSGVRASMDQERHEREKPRRN